VSDVVYLDVCCLKRPFDDQRSTRVQLEARLVALGRKHRDALRVEITNPIHVLELLTGGLP
jgi:hypothetical protein